MKFMILIFVLYAVFSAMTFINSALMASNPYPFIVGMIRALGSSFLLLGYAWLFCRKALIGFRCSWADWKDLLTYGILIHAFVMCGFSYAVQYADPVSICFIVASAPFLTAFIQYLQGSERLNQQKLLGLLVGFCGLVPILYSSGELNKQPRVDGLAWWGNLIAFLAMIVFCYGWIVLKKFLKRHTYPLQIINGIAMLIGGFVSTIIVLLVHGPSFISVPFSTDFPMLMTAFLASSLMTYMLYAHLLTVYSTTFISFAGFLEPALGLLYGVLFWGYPISVSAYVSLIVLFLGLLIFYKEELKELRS